MSARICMTCGDKYYWIIDRDYHAEPGAKPKTLENAVGIDSGKASYAAMFTPFAARMPDRFVMKDDDKNTYYGGLLYCGCGFEPLDDFGMPNAGATEIWLNGKLV